ncbi:MAG: thioesterase [Synergistaceae bacterium]|nr:thioesterase [Synergistaceae bacterium]
MTEVDNLVPFSGIDPRGRLKFSVLLEMFQEMADIDASKYGLSVRQTLEHNITWVLRKYRIDISRYPRKEDGTIKIKTYAEPFRNLFSLRTFKFWNPAGEYLGSAYAWWVLIDTVKLRPIRLDKCELMSAFMTQVSEELPSDVKVPELAEAQLEETWKVRWQDLDVNDHTNHAVYFSWALDTVPDDVPEKMTPMFVEGEFLHPVPRTRVRCLTQELPSDKGRCFVHSLRHIDDETEYAKISSVWR